MKIHILGICGTFMGGIALLARSRGHSVSGSDQNVYPPMSTQLAAQGIELREGYRPEHIEPDTDQVIVGNALSRGNSAVEHVLDSGLRYVSGPQWLAEEYLSSMRVLAVAGTHGKTTASSMLAWILDSAGLDPGFLIGGVPANFGVSARPGGGRWFVIEADEYDTAFFDKRSKFVHYRPSIAILNNLEYDHADIFPDLGAIQTQFHHLIRTIPGSGTIVANADDQAIAVVLERGCWTPVQRFGRGEADWRAEFAAADGSAIAVTDPDGNRHQTGWRLRGEHNLLNATAAVAAAAAAGVPPARAVAALGKFRNPLRRQELLCERNDIRVYDDFAHHPTAIRRTLEGLRQDAPARRLLVALEPRSNSMRAGVHAAALAPALALADRIVVLARPELGWDAAQALAPLGERCEIAPDAGALLSRLTGWVRPGDSVVFMSNGGFDSAPRRFADQLAQHAG